MENDLRRKPSAVSTGSRRGLSADEYEQYKLQTRGEYEDHMMKFEFRCRRVAMMYYHENSQYDTKVYYMEMLAALLGTVSFAAIGSYFMLSQDSVWVTMISKLGSAGAFGAFGAFIIELKSRGSTSILPSFRQQAQAHVTAGAAWQALAQKTRSKRIQLDNPKMDVTDYAEWYHDLITQRDKLLEASAVLPESTYQMYSDPAVVFLRLKIRKHLFMQFLELERMDADDFVERKTAV